MSNPAAAPPGLIELGGNPSLPAYVRTLWQRRQFAYANAAGEMRSQHMDTVLGSLWHLLNPILLIAVYYLVFGVLLGINRGIPNFIGFLAIGVFTYHWSQKTIQSAARTIIASEGLIRSLQFPRALLPISSVMREALAFVPAVIVMVIVVVVTELTVDPDVNPGLEVTWLWLLVIPSLLLQLTFNLGGALLVARVSNAFRDTVNILPFVFRLAFYGSGVIFALEDRLDAIGHLDLLPWFLLNPFYVFVSLPREYLLSGTDHQLVPWMWVSAVVWTIAMLVGGLLIFRAGEREYGRG